MHTVYLNIGSNQGDRRAHIEQAVALIASLSQSPVLRSAYIESEPWGFESSHRFLNIGIAITTSLEPLELLDRLQAIERRVSPAPHRDADGLYIDRAIDIDIILIDDLHIDTPRLTVPHPRMHLRDFVMKPLQELLAMKSGKK